MGRRVATVVSVLAVLVVASPVVHERDSYPLSTYPMFSHDRGRVASIDTAVGVHADGTWERLNPNLIAGGIEVIHAAVTVTESVRRGDTPALCAEIAARVATSSARRDVVAVEVVSETHDVVAWFDGADVPVARTVHAECAVTR